MKKMKISWFSAGVSSFVACYLAKDVDEIIYIDIDDQHPDSIRFVHDCENILQKPITILKSEYGSVENVCRQFRTTNTPYGSKCTQVLKKRVRKEWEAEHPGRHTYIWGFDCNEEHRAERLFESMPRYDHEFPLIENNLTKQDVHGICNRLGLKRPAMYDLGYNNNNCIGCMKGGKGYWNKIRIDFPDVFASRAKLEREIGQSCINGVFLDELEPDAGRMSGEILEDCSIFCQLAII